MTTLIFGGRFQPFHIGHLCVVRALAEQYTENIVLGVIAPDPERHFPGDEKNWWRFSRDKNPLGFWERLELIQQSVGEFRSRITAIVPLPRPSVNLQRANNYIPPKPRVFVLCQKWGDEIEQWKAQAYQQNGEQLHFVEFNNLDPLAQLASGELIRSLMRLSNPAWKLFVVPTAAHVLENKETWRKMVAQLTTDKANAFLTGFFANDRLGSLLRQVVESAGDSTTARRDITTSAMSLANGLALLRKLVEGLESGKSAQINIAQHIYMKEQYSAGQVFGGFGKQVSLHDVNVQQLAQTLQSGKGLETLASELEELRVALKKKATTNDHDIAVAEVGLAQKLAQGGDGTTVIEHLRRVGSWVLDTAKEIGVNVAADAIEKSLGL